MDEPSSCGQGLAGRAQLPRKLGALLTALSGVLEAHVRALDVNEPEAKHELDAYAALVVAHRDVAGRLTSIADQMAGYRDLPMATHDEALMSDTLAYNVFQEFVQQQAELTALLQQLSHDDQQMLQAMEQ